MRASRETTTQPLPWLWAKLVAMMERQRRMLLQNSSVNGGLVIIVLCELNGGHRTMMTRQ